jgi:hypothetical protein
VLLAKIIGDQEISECPSAEVPGCQPRGCAAAAKGARREAICATFRAIISIPFRSFKLIG